MLAREAALFFGVFSAGLSVGYGPLPTALVRQVARLRSPVAAPLASVVPPAPTSTPPAPVAVTALGVDRLETRESAGLRALRSMDVELLDDPGDSAAGRTTKDVHLCGVGVERRVCTAEEPTGSADTSWIVGLRAPDLPVHVNVRVERFFKYLTASPEGRKLFRKWYRRSGLHHDVVTQALRDRGLPEDLEAMVYVESGYSPTAVSSTGAVGLWQFMPGTARVYGLAVERDYDERRGVEKSTDAATRYLSELYDRFGSWELALAAYDMGYAKLTQRIQELSTNDYWTLSEIPGALPEETLGYVPKVLAVALLLRNKDRFGIDDVPLDVPESLSGVQVPGGTPLSVVARAAGTSVAHLSALNPEILTSNVPDRGAPLLVQVPSSGLARANVMLPRLLSRDQRMDPGERVSDAFDWGTDETLPRDDASARSARVTVFYSVGQRETLASIADRFSIDVDDIVTDNHLDPVAKLQKGMLLQLRVPRAALRTPASQVTQLAQPTQLTQLTQPTQRVPDDDRAALADAAGLSGQGKP